jgi:hypothetical protein
MLHVWYSRNSSGLRRGFSFFRSAARSSTVATSTKSRTSVEYRPMMATRMNTLPTIVYMKNFMAAYFRRPAPQTPIRKYMGTSISS